MDAKQSSERREARMTQVEHLASFVVRARFDDLSAAALGELKGRVLDALGCALGALDAEPVGLLAAQIDEFGGRELCTLIGGGRTAPDRAALYNSALVRYLDFNDSYPAEGETCHPSDNLGAVLAAAEYAGQSGREFLASLAVAYQVQCRLCDVAPVRAKGFDHVTHGAYAVAAGVARALGLDERRAAHALAISGTALNALRVTRTGVLSHWKGLAYPNTAFAATHAAFLAMRGVTGPLEVFEGNKGFMETIAGPFTIDWPREDLERVTRTIVKKYNAEAHSQSALEAADELRRQYRFKPEEITRVEIDTFDVAYHIIGGGEEGDKTVVHTKEQADHSMPYLVAVMLLDGRVTPEQFRAERIGRRDVQELLRKVVVRPVEALSRRFPAQMPCRLRITLADGRSLVREKEDYEGYHTRPMPWEAIVRKFDELSAPHADASLRAAIVQAVAGLETIPIAQLTGLLAAVRHGGAVGEPLETQSLAGV
jgi:2-methylcitrate dehydratase